MAEHGLAPPVLGVAWDGTGYGPDGTVWGGEFILVDDDRLAPRGAPAARSGCPAARPRSREPRRSALGLLFAAFGREALAMADLAPVAAFTPAERATLAAMLERGVNAPLTTSAGRLFDAVAALLGLRQRATYEGQAAAELEWMAGDGGDRSATALRSFPIVADGPRRPALIVDWGPRSARSSPTPARRLRRRDRARLPPGPGACHRRGGVPASASRRSCSPAAASRMRA